MRLVTYSIDGEVRLGALVGDDVVDLAAAAGGVAAEPAFTSMLALIEAGDAALAHARALVAAPPAAALVARDKIKLLAPLPVPTQIRDFSAFEQHMLQSGAAVFRMNARRAGTELPTGPIKLPPVWYDQPIYYKANRFAVGGDGDDIIWPKFSKVADYELEMAVVIGRKGCDIAKADAAKHIFGYTIYNDFSARDTQGYEMTGPFGPAKGKDFDGSIILGPCIVTADDDFDPYAVAMTAHVNGDLWSSGSMAAMHWRFEDMIAYVSTSETLYPGEVLGGGTIGGGCGLEFERFLGDGDVVELTVEGIGTLRNRVVGAHLLGGTPA